MTLLKVMRSGQAGKNLRFDRCASASSRPRCDGAVVTESLSSVLSSQVPRAESPHISRAQVQLVAFAGQTLLEIRLTVSEISFEDQNVLQDAREEFLT